MGYNNLLDINDMKEYLKYNKLVKVIKYKDMLC